MSKSRSPRLPLLVLGSLLPLLTPACEEAPPPKPPSVPVATPRPSTQPTPEPVASAPKVDALSRRYLDGLFRAKPHLATFMGDHRFDASLPEVSHEATTRRVHELEALTDDLAKAAPGNQDERIDADILRDAIGLELLYLREIRDWEWDPRLSDSFPYYDPREILAERLADLIHGDFAPAEARRASVTAQLEAVPRFLTEVRAALTKPEGQRRTPKVYCERAIADNKGRIEFFEGELKTFTAGDARAEAARAGAVTALRAYQTFLEKELLPTATGEWRLGRALYAKKFPLALQTDRSPEDSARRATTAFQAAREELLTLSVSLAHQLWPGEKPAPRTAATVNRVKEALSTHHPKPDALVAAHGANLDRMRSFITSHDLLGLPPKETLSVAPMPAFKRGASGAEYLAPGVLDGRPSFHATYYVDPVDPSWSKARVESYLRGQNDYEVQLVAMHEAYPGHHTQFFYSRKNLNPLRAVLWNAAMVEGWAVYAEGQMVTAGWGDRDNDRYRFYDLRGQMISAANTVLDVKLQSGDMTDDEAIRFMVDDGFQERAMAEKKLLRAKLDSTQLAQYFLGLDEIRALEKEYRARVGDKFRARAFNEALISHGSIAVKLLRRYLLEG